MRSLKTALFISILCILNFGHSVIAQNFSGTSFQEALETGQADVTVLYLQEEGFAYYDDEGNLTGIHIDIFEHFATWLRNAKGVDLNINYVSEAESFSRFYQSVQNGDGGVFGLGTVTILERRRSEVAFTPPFLTNIAVLVSNDAVPEIQTLDDIPSSFGTLTGLSIQGTTLEDRMNELRDSYLPELSLRNVESQVEALDLIINDPGVFCYLDLSIYWPAMQQNQPIRRHAAADQASELFGYIMPVDSDWVEPFTEFFNLGSGYRTTTTYRNTLVRHMGVEVTRMLELARRQTD